MKIKQATALSALLSVILCLPVMGMNAFGSEETDVKKKSSYDLNSSISGTNSLAIHNNQINSADLADELQNHLNNQIPENVNQDNLNQNNQKAGEGGELRVEDSDGENQEDLQPLKMPYVDNYQNNNNQESSNPSDNSSISGPASSLQSKYSDISVSSVQAQTGSNISN